MTKFKYFCPGITRVSFTLKLGNIHNFRLLSKPCKKFLNINEDLKSRWQIVRIEMKYVERAGARVYIRGYAWCGRERHTLSGLHQVQYNKHSAAVLSPCSYLTLGYHLVDAIPTLIV